MKNVLTYLEETAARYPYKKAVGQEDNSFTFSEIRDLASRLGQKMMESGFTDGPVGVLAERDADTIVYFMAVLYSGCFYVPIDPDLPQEKRHTATFRSSAFCSIRFRICFILLLIG